jgi:hypothetical protein
MLKRIKESWHFFRQAEPGSRFIEYYRRRQKSRQGTTARIASVLVGVIVLAAGLVALVAPGPGILLMAVGAGLIARESERMSRVLDWLELRARSAVHHAFQTWRGASMPLRVLLVLILALGAGAVGYAAYQITFGH